MKSKIDNYNQIVKDLKKDYQNFTDFELLSLAIQIERNQLIENGLVVSTDDKTPSGLEAIAIALGFENTFRNLNKEVDDLIQRDNTEEIQCHENDNPSTYRLPIEKLNLTSSTKNLLRKQEINTVGDLVCFTEKGIEDISYMKSKSVADIKKALSNMGLQLGMKKHS